MAEELKISVITVSYNHGEFIRQTIESVLAQNYQNFEHIVVDGGSTDNTLDILRSYPHLQWTSEPDRGQTHALEKGFRRATGEIVAWINSDDWYAPGTFHEVAAALKEYPLLLTPAVETDRAGTPKQTSPNLPRTWHQLLKYWVPYAWLAQSSVFFRRHVLDEVVRPDGTYLDESLYYVMDFDLWLRMAKRYPMTKYLDRVCSYFRIYDENKTGKEGDAAQRECSRVFRRAAAYGSAEARFSVIVSVDAIGPALDATLKSINEQTLRDHEVILMPLGSVNAKELRAYALAKDREMLPQKVRAGSGASRSYLEACQRGASQACGTVLIFLAAGDRINPSFSQEAANLFVIDWVGMLLPLGGRRELLGALTERTEHGETLSLVKILSGPQPPPKFAVRAEAFRDVGGLGNFESPIIAMRSLLLNMVHGSWKVSCSGSLGVEEAAPVETQDDKFPVFYLYAMAKMIDDLTRKNEASSFLGYIQSTQGQSIAFPKETVEAARKLLSRAPEAWERIDYVCDVMAMRDLAGSHPFFSPAVYFMALKEPDKSRSAALMAACEQLRTEEASIWSGKQL